MANLGLSGLSTGLDTRALVSQLMAIERRPITLMEKTQAQSRTKIDLYRQINTKLVALQRAAQKVMGLPFNGAVAAGATATDPSKLSATVNAAAASGTYGMNVLTLARSQVTGGGAFNAPGLSATPSLDGNLTNATATAAAAPGTNTYNYSSLQHYRAEITNGRDGINTSIGTKTGVLTLTKADGTFVDINLTNAENSSAAILAKIKASSDAFGITATLDGSNRLVFTGSDGGDFTLTGTARTLDALGLHGNSNSTAVLTAGRTTTSQTAALASVTIGGVTKTASGYKDDFTAADLGLPGVSFSLAAGAADGSASSLTVTNTGGTLRITDVQAGTYKDVAITGGTSASVRDAINAAGSGMTATLDGSGRLVLTGATGKAFTVGDAGGGSAFAASLGIDTPGRTTQTAQQASISIDGGAAITSNTNTFVDPLTGVTINALALGTTTLTVQAGSVITAQDTAEKAATLDGIRDLVSQFNDVLGFIKQQASYDASTKKGGALLGDAMAADLRGGLTRMFTEVVDDAGTFRTAFSAGLELQRDGTIKLDEAKLKASLEEDPSALKALFTQEDGLAPLDVNGFAVKTNAIGRAGVVGDGLANRLNGFIDSMISSASSYSGTDANGIRAQGGLLRRISANEALIGDIDKRIEAYKRRLEMREETLLAKFNAMEKVVAMMRNQGNYLSTQLYSSFGSSNN
jgi:flagellar hook-associated protein 2